MEGMTLVQGSLNMPSRYVCDVLEEMRKCLATNNFSYLPGLIEEAQVMVNRMEAGLGDKSDIDWRVDELARLKKDIKALKKEKSELVKQGDSE